MKNFVLLLVIISASSQVFSQETRYIRDELYVPLRSGQSMQHRIVHKGLVSGTALTVLEMSEDQTYSRVRTRRGTEGWIQTQYLSKEPAGRDLLKVANASIEKLEQQNQSLKQELSALRAQEQKSRQQLDDLNRNNSSISSELSKIKAISSNAIQINQDNQRLLEENQMLGNKVDILTTDNQRLIDNQESDAFLNGAFAVLIGVMITLLVPRLWPKKSTDWA